MDLPPQYARHENERRFLVELPLAFDLGMLCYHKNKPAITYISASRISALTPRVNI